MASAVEARSSQRSASAWSLTANGWPRKCSTPILYWQREEPPADAARKWATAYGQRQGLSRDMVEVHTGLSPALSPTPALHLVCRLHLLTYLLTTC